MISFFVEHYMVTVMAAAAFLVFISCNSTDSKNNKVGFFWSSICVILVSLAEVAEHYYASLSYPCTMRIICSAIAYTARPSIIYFLIRVPVKRLYPKLEKLLALPLILDAAVYLSALFSPLSFSFDAGNHFHRGPLGFMAFAVALVYFAVLIYLCILRIRRGETIDLIICLTGMIACVISVFMEYEMSHFGILPEAAIISEIFYFVYLIMTKYSTDYLTGAYLRAHMYKEASARKCDRYYITFDVNGLKRINDRDGHDAGDQALRTFSQAVFSCMPQTALFYRLGGDEFAILVRTAVEEEILQLIEHIKEDCQSLPYGTSSGYAYFKNPADFEKACKEADDMLYRNKRAFWEQYEAGNDVRL